MTSNYDDLDHLKKEVQETSNKQAEALTQKAELQKAKSYQEQELEENQAEMAQLISSLIGRSEVAETKERELLTDRIEKFSHNQSVMNEQLIALNDNITDVTSLEAVYRAKRDFLESNYQEQESALTAQLNGYQSQLDETKSKLGIKETELAQIISKIKKKTFISAVKETFLDKFVVLFSVGLVILFLGGASGWGIFELFSSGFEAVGNFFGTIFK